MNMSNVSDFTAENRFIFVILTTESAFGIISNTFLFFILASKDIQLNLLIRALLMVESVYKGVFSLFNGLKEGLFSQDRLVI